MFFQECNRASNCRRWRLGRKLRNDQVVGPGADRTHEFRSTSFDRAKHVSSAPVFRKSAASFNGNACRRRERPKVFFQKQVRVIIAHVAGRMNLLSTEPTSRFLQRILLGVLALLGSLLCQSAAHTPTSRITPNV